MGCYDRDWDNESLASAKVYVGGLVSRLGEDGLTYGEAYTAPNAANGIVDAADKNAADLTVMSTQALTGPAPTLLGSVANLIVRTAHCPLVHHPQGNLQCTSPRGS